MQSFDSSQESTDKKSTDGGQDGQNKFEDEVGVETYFDAVNKCDSSISCC